MRGMRTRFTFGPSDEISGLWSRDGVDMVFNSRRTGPLDLYRKAANGAETEELLLADRYDKTPTSWSSDRQFILYNVASAQGNDLGTAAAWGAQAVSVWRHPVRRTVGPVLAGWPLGRVRFERIGPRRGLRGSASP